MIPSRTARPASTAWNFVKTAVQATVLWIVFLVAVPLAIHTVAATIGLGAPGLPPVPVVAVGAVVLAAASALNLAAAHALAAHGAGTPLPLDATRRLVARGPYRRVRNPMAIAGIAQGVGVGILLGSPLVVGYALAGGVLWHVVIRPWEERDLLARFGDDYARYRDAVPLWRPGAPFEDAVGPDGLEPPTSSV